MKQDPLAPGVHPSTVSSHHSYQQRTPISEVDHEAPPAYTTSTNSTTMASPWDSPPATNPSDSLRGSSFRDGYVPEPAMSTTNFESDPWAKYDNVPGCCFSSTGGSCFSRRGGCLFSDTEGCCLSRNRGCCFSSGRVRPLPTFYYPSPEYLLRPSERSISPLSDLNTTFHFRTPQPQPRDKGLR